MFGNERRKEFVKGRSSLADAEFVAMIGLPPHLHRFATAARQALAKCCGVPASTIQPEDSPESLRKLTGDWDDVAVILEMESILGISIGDDIPRFVGGRFFWRHWPGASSVGEWCRKVAEQIDSAQASTGQPLN